MPDIVEQFPPCKWVVEGKSFTFAITSIEESYSNRLVPHERVYRDGARLDDTGSKATVWTIAAEFYNDLDEPGVTFGPSVQYPDRVDAFTDSLKIHETGELTTPTRGKRRARLESYTRNDTADTRDHATVNLTFMEDNEDDARQQEFSGVNGAGAARKAAEEGTDAGYSEGAGGGFDMSDLNEFASELEGLMNAPGNFVGDIEAKANAIQRKVQSVEDTFTRNKNEAETEVTLLLTQPSASFALRRMRRSADIAKKLADKKAASQQLGITTVTFPRIMSIYDVATKMGQAPQELIVLNSAIEDMLRIPAKTPVTVLDTPAVRNAKGGDQNASAA
ncbi:MAG: DNA circularization N-terminal domain-containing protein [Planctomycetota bacterium]